MAGQTPDAGYYMSFLRVTDAVWPDRGRAPVDDVLQGPGIVAGSLILTADGAVPVELLGRGDRIITRTGGMVQLRGISLHLWEGDFVYLAAGAMGKQRPESDTIIAVDQALLWRGGMHDAVAQDRSVASGNGAGGAVGGAEKQAVITARDLVQMGIGILQTGIGMHLARLRFDKTELVYADGVEVLCPAACAARQAA